MHRLNIAFDRRWWITSAAVLLVVAGLGGAARAAATDEAEASVRHLVVEIIRILSSDGIKQADSEARRKLAAVIGQEADLDLLGRLVLGRYWRQLDDEQKQRYLKLFHKYMMGKFVGYLRAYTGKDLGPADEVFEITGSRQVDERDIVVTSKVRPPGREPLDVRWRLRGLEHPAVIDVVVEDASLLISLRSEFASVIERRGIEGLFDELQSRIGQARSAVPSRPKSSRT